MKSLAEERKLELAWPFLQKKGINVEKMGESWWKSALEVVWEEVDNFTDLFAAQGDFMTFLAAAKDIREAGAAQLSINNVQ